MTRTILTLSLATSLTACGAPDPEVCDLLADIDESTVVERNGLAINGLAMNGADDAVTFNGLAINGADDAVSFNGLAMNGWNVQGLPVNGLMYQGTQHQGASGTTDTPLDRLTERALTTDGRTATEGTAAFVQTPYGDALLYYATRCALDEDQAVDVPVGDDIVTVYGSLGLAPAWTHRGLDDTEERKLTACLLAHTNHWALPVPISLRGAEIPTTDPEEVAFGVYEGTFFGSLRYDEVYTCHGDSFEEATDRSPDRTLRVCTDGEESCGFTSLGMCEDVCERYVDGEGWTACRAGDDLYSETLSVHLRDGEVVAACAQ